MKFSASFRADWRFNEIVHLNDGRSKMLRLVERYHSSVPSTIFPGCSNTSPHAFGSRASSNAKAGAIAAAKCHTVNYIESNLLNQVRPTGRKPCAPAKNWQFRCRYSRHHQLNPWKRGTREAIGSGATKQNWCAMIHRCQTRLAFYASSKHVAPIHSHPNYWTVYVLFFVAVSAGWYVVGCMSFDLVKEKRNL